MEKNFSKIPNWFKLIVILILLVSLGYGVWFFMNKPPVKPPAEFLTARQRGTEISQKVVELTSVTNQKIKEINSFDLNGDILKAMAMIEEAKNKNQEANTQALKLLDEMSKMLESSEKISLFSGRETVVEAVRLEVSLIINFTDYTQLVNQFLSNLYKAIATSDSNYRRLAEEDLEEINTKTWTINSLNQQFLEEMRVFDKSFSL